MENKELLPAGFNIKSFLKEDENSNIESTKFVSKLRNTYGNFAPFLIEQLKLYPKAKNKLPAHTGHFCLFTSKSFEQSSSEVLAEFKKNKFSGKSLLDLTGGLGIDDWGFSKSFGEVVSVDADTNLNEIARYNFGQMSINNVTRIDADAYEFIKQDLHFDMVYIDSDRRANLSGKKAVTLHNSEPSILKLEKRLFEISNAILLKLSPLVDISYLLNTLNNISKIYVVSLNNEVKEILALMKKIGLENIEINAIDINKNGTESEFSSVLPDLSHANYTTDGKYFYEPSNALIKSGLAINYAVNNGLKPIGKNSLYMLSDKHFKDFFGRKFEVIAKVLFGKSKVKEYLKVNGINKANVSKRNFTLSVSEIRKLFSLADGGEEYLFFTNDAGNQKLMIHCKKT